MSVAIAPTALVIRRVPIDQVHADPANANEHDELNLRTIRDSLLEWGQVEPLVIWANNGRVIGGNGRLQVMLELGWTEVDVVDFQGNATEAALLAVALNRTGQTGKLNDASVARILAAASSDGFSTLGAGFTDEEARELIARVNAENDGGSTPGANGTDPGTPTPPNATPAERFGVPPFSVLDARQGYWQDRKREWLSLGIQSELGRGGDCQPSGQSSCYNGTSSWADNRSGARGDASPGGSPRPAMKLENGHTVRGNGKGGKLGG